MTLSPIQTSDKTQQIHLSSSVFSGNMDSTDVALGVDVENSFAQVLLNLTSLIPLDSLTSKSSLRQLPEMLLSPLFQGSGPDISLLPNPEPLLSLFSMNRNSPMPPMCFVPVPEDAEEKEPEPIQNPSPLRSNSPTARDCQGTNKSLFCNGDNGVIPACGTIIPQEPYHKMENGSLNQTWNASPQLQAAGTAEMEEALRIQTMWQLSQHATLAARAGRTQQRLLAMLGQHASRHYAQQVEGLKKKLLEVHSTPKSPMVSGDLFTPTGNKTFDAVGVQEGEWALRKSFQCPQAHRKSLNSRELQNLARCGHAVLHGALEALDSDATVSSSDEEWEHEDSKRSSAESDCHGCEWRWLKDRAELGSRWTWLQMRLAELDSQIQQLGGLHQQILANKGRVVLAESQPMTDSQIQHTLWTETMDLSFTAGNMQDLPSDIEMEPSSPTRLLRNIERQSAQLTQIVNSLMMPLCVSSPSPVSKGPCSRWRAQQKTPYSSQATDTGIFLPNGPQRLNKAGQKRKRTCQRRQCPSQLDVTCVSARTRPLLTYHKPRLFIKDASSCKKQVLESLSSLCPSCASCDSATVCTDLTCPRSKQRTDGRAHPVLSLSSETSSPLHLQNALYRENRLQLFGFHHRLSSGSRVSRSLFSCNHRPKNKRHLKSHRTETTPIRWSRSHQDHYSWAHRERRKRKRRASEIPMDMHVSNVMDQSDLVSQSDESHMEEYSEEVASGHDTPTQQRNSQFPLNRRNGQNVFSIDNIVIPMSASVKVERRQYKDILTPSWRKVDIIPLEKREEDEPEEGELESLKDEDFSQKHKSYERREKLRWSNWEQNRRHRLNIRSSRRRCSTLSVSKHPAHCRPPVLSTWNSCPPDQSESSLNESKPVLPWKRRMFPLDEEDEDALKCDEDEGRAGLTLWSESNMYCSVPSCFSP